MTRICFREQGKQKEFLDKVIAELTSPSLRGLLQFGISTNYTSLKNYYTERRCLPKDLFEDLCILSHMDKNSLDITEKGNSWGQVKGGKKSKRGKHLKEV